VYGRLCKSGFVNFDDPTYVTDNPAVRAGLKLTGLVWAFSAAHAANWIPLAWLSHMADCQFFGLRSGFHHLSNIVLHVIGAILLFGVLKSMTGATWRSAGVAFLFAFHPLHVESVAWISERKDVLCGVFWLLTLWGYVRYAKAPSAKRYVLALIPFCLGLLAKPMIVTLPFVLLLLDVWPLRRLEVSGRPEQRDQTRLFVPTTWHGALVEKLPFLAFAVGASVVTFFAQEHGGAVNAHPFTARLANALISYVVYIGKMFWPTRLAVFYPFPVEIADWQVAAASIVLLALSAAAVASIRRRPYLTIGWFWYIGTLLPVIGLVEVGAQSRADRYTYIPMIGLFIALVWAGAELFQRWPASRPAVAAVSAVASVGCLLLTWVQTGQWKDSLSLFRHAIAVTEGNYVAYNNLGRALKDQGNIAEAVRDYQEALRIMPDYLEVLVNMGAIALERGHPAEALGYLSQALRQGPGYPPAHVNMGIALGQLGRAAESVREFREALRFEPDYAEAHSELGTALATLGQTNEALDELEEAVKLRPDVARSHNNLGNALMAMGRLPEAMAEFRAALRIQPGYADAHFDLGIALESTSLPDAMAEYQAALRAEPGHVQAHVNLGVALARIPDRMLDAIAELQAAIRLQPDSAKAHECLGAVLARLPGRLPDAIAEFRTALRIDANFLEAHYYLAYALAQVPGRLPDAIAECQELLRLSPNDEPGRHLMASLLAFRDARGR
jgi:tetratricopeptide (TPR) repeat protein